MKYLVAILCLVQSSWLLAQEYTFGVVPQYEPQKLIEIWQPLLEQVSEQTGVKIKLVTVESIPVFEQAFANGEYDFAYMNPWHSVIAYEKQGYLPLIKDASRKLQGVLVVNKDSGITELSQLEGAEIAFPAPNALGASLLMRVDLAQLYGLTIKPVYVQTHSSVYLNVALNSTKAGGGVLGTLKQQPQNLQDKLNILYRTREISRHPIVAHPNVLPKIQLQVQQAILDIGQSEEHKHLLAGIPIIKPSIATLADYQQLTQWGLRSFYVEN
ncbi:phosphate/phosphite/phosphonate ABC transporter substrate-binding protein [Shewanella ulleungensis]|uniref:Phosphate ABC transporter substrate-binding protein n=1 Tax=Shewanella ulleungensis TaxID=2282699 RepID=A0ABQ2QH91_9GAMM|nr:phosphate/phosphite/phosphonate ABC transporter substrate-binding protein [Shewanella ulleungensis]MCL1149427.1 phosphate/phosphite/phosphonate ABC transporter substrate-binding protein [Shewanella ulleungensis]GGP79057.1 phosphate ABC transporter substrate-binding protein [Shewanella ulleungensis]